MSRVIVISAHPDDEILGAGGTLLKHVNEGDSLYWLIVTNIYEDQGFTSKKVRKRQNEITEVAKALKVSETYKLNYKSMSLSSQSIPSLVADISEVFKEVKPNVVYSVNRTDAHSDHKIAFDAVMACTKSFRYPWIRKVLAYECISETEFAPAVQERLFMPNYFIDITYYFNRKLEIMNIYESEMGEHPFPRNKRNIEALATYRGAIAGVEYAEAFQLIKCIE